MTLKIDKKVHIDLFSGIGGFALAADRTWGKENVDHVFCEIESFPQKVLKKHWPDAPIHSDIKEFRYDGPTPFILTGGFPCQPFSVAGKQRGTEDDRALWPEMLRVISESKPRWIIGENVGGFVNMGLDDCLSDLEGIGYDCQPMVIPACAVDAKHRRDRVWIVAHTTGERCVETRTDSGRPSQRTSGASSTSEDVANTNTARSQGREETGDTSCGRKERKQRTERCSESQRRENWPIEPAVGRVANGVSDRVDRIKGLGNAIVPQVAQVIMQFIQEVESL